MMIDDNQYYYENHFVIHVYIKASHLLIQYFLCQMHTNKIDKHSPNKFSKLKS